MTHPAVNITHDVVLRDIDSELLYALHALSINFYQ